MIPHNRPTLDIEEEEAAIRVLRSGWLTQGKEVEAFENEFCKFIGLPGGHAVAVSSGTASLFLSLWVLNAKNKKISFLIQENEVERFEQFFLNKDNLINLYYNYIDFFKLKCYIFQ